VCEYNYGEMSDQALASLVAYNAVKLAKAPAAVLAEVREDLEEAALLLVAATEFAEERVVGVHGVADSMFLGPAA
jgi:hypothetical protein